MRLRRIERLACHRSFAFVATERLHDRVFDAVAVQIFLSGGQAAEFAVVGFLVALDQFGTCRLVERTRTRRGGRAVGLLGGFRRRICVVLPAC